MAPGGVVRPARGFGLASSSPPPPSRRPTSTARRRARAASGSHSHRLEQHLERGRASGRPARPPAASATAPGPPVEGRKRFRLVLYQKPGCESCGVLKGKVSALLERAKFAPSPLSDCESVIEERDVGDDLRWMIKFGGSVPELGCVVDGDEENEVLLPRVSHRDTTQSIGVHLERALGGL